MTFTVSISDVWKKQTNKQTNKQKKVLTACFHVCLSIIVSCHHCDVGLQMLTLTGKPIRDHCLLLLYNVYSLAACMYISCSPHAQACVIGNMLSAIRFCRLLLMAPHLLMIHFNKAYFAAKLYLLFSTCSGMCDMKTCSLLLLVLPIITHNSSDLLIVHTHYQHVSAIVDMQASSHCTTMLV